MIGKPIQCDGPTAQMTWVFYARILIEIDLLSHLSSTITVILLNGSTLVQQIVYESLPCYCKQCKSLVEKQGQYCVGSSINPQEDPMSTKDATAGPLRTQSPGRKRSKVVGTELPNTLPEKVGTTPAPLKRQYLTRSKATGIPCMRPQPKNPARVFQLLHSSDDSAPSSTL
ncbi:hypothetical protein NC651_028587 [Populus alba x Populus x berolinensis]|nr:hypothetical protein NC651_028587 [Populus alba x Populus x berolinensis]